ncbi:MAG: hypothetical protein KKD00_00310 [Gammaproteobacteria bacterium]|nr:hypothetical protein [Gammaproteobacteria bacterium]
MSSISVNSSFSTGIYGMQLASQGMQQSAQQIASAGVQSNDGGAAINAAITGNTNTAEPIINLKTDLRLFTASAKVVETADDMLGSLLDVRV